MNKNTKGIVLAGGTGSRLFPITKAVSKHLLPVYDKPMIYYSLSVLMLAGIRDVLIITNPKDLRQYIDLLGDGNAFGIKIKYKTQENPKGIAECFLIGEDYIGESDVVLVLGDNIFYGQGFTPALLKAKENLANNRRSTIFAYMVNNPKSFGVLEFSEEKILSIEEKPEHPKSNYAVTGLYFYTNSVVNLAKNLQPSARGELEISAINNELLKEGALDYQLLGRGFAWLDTGTSQSLIEASQFVQTIENRQGIKVACLEEIALNQHWINKKSIESRFADMDNNSYSNYLKHILEQ